MRTPAHDVPTLSKMVRDGWADTIQHGRRTRESLDYWFRQSERLNIARSHYGLRGTRFTDFARRIGVDRSSAFELVKLHQHRAAILSDCSGEQEKAVGRGETYFYPGWRTLVERLEGEPSHGRLTTTALRARSQTSSFAYTPKVFLYEGDNLLSLRSIPESVEVDVCITSPPYFQKFDYQNKGQHGLESSVEEYLQVQVSVFHEVQRLLHEGGTCFIVIGDTSNNYSPIRAKGQRKGGDKQWLMRRSLERNYRQKETLNVPFRLAEALRRDGWVHRSTLIWDKTGRSAVANSDATPECHEYVLHMVKWSSQKGRPYGNTQPLTRRSFVIMRSHILSTAASFRSAWSRSYYRSALPRPIILDPYIGSGTVAVAAKSVSGSTVYGFDLDCAAAREAIPDAACLTSSPSDRHTWGRTEMVVRDGVRVAKRGLQAGRRASFSASAGKAAPQA